MVTIDLKDDLSPGEKLSYVVIAARYNGSWLFVKHRERGGYEMPAGHPEPGESSVEAAVRELMEETGAVAFTIEPVSYYTVDGHSGKKNGRLFFAWIDSVGDIPDNSEIEGVETFHGIPDNLSLHEVMTALFRRAEEYLRYTQY